MTISEIMQSQNMSQYRLAKDSGIPYMTLNDICSGKTRLEKCSAETVYRLSSALHVSMEDLLKEYLEPRPSFELFKSNVCHRLKELGDINFLIRTIEAPKQQARRDAIPEFMRFNIVESEVRNVN